ncbi:MAG TPA: TetR/AcrR family transcriptional regulator [Polyangiaceae bacterium]|nr:TetR/AcrR family transcriptional regulator [Polyangiaceae bacterium]
MAPSARKRPQQPRAKETVRAILEATTQILDRESLEAATTTRIAEVAGVSIGSLYQYFSHRDAILDALQDREFERTMAVMQSVFADGNLGKAPIETVTAALRGLAHLYAQSPGLHRVLAIEGLRVAKAERVQAFDLRVIELVRHFLLAARAPLRVNNVEAAAFIIFQSVRATMLAHLLERPAGLDVDGLVGELTGFLTAYVLGGVPAARLPESNGASTKRKTSRADSRLSSRGTSRP